MLRGGNLLRSAHTSHSGMSCQCTLLIAVHCLLQALTHAEWEGVHCTAGAVRTADNQAGSVHASRSTGQGHPQGQGIQAHAGSPAADVAEWSACAHGVPSSWMYGWRGVGIDRCGVVGHVVEEEEMSLCRKLCRRGCGMVPDCEMTVHALNPSLKGMKRCCSSYNSGSNSGKP